MRAGRSRTATVSTSKRAELTDGSASFNVLYDEGARYGRPGLRLRFACASEQLAWAFADELANLSWIEVRE